MRYVQRKPAFFHAVNGARDAQYPTKWLPIDGDSETYGTDTTYYLHDADATPPVPATQPAIT